MLVVRLILIFKVSECVVALVSVDTPVGIIHGTVGTDFSMFLGIPYGVVDENNPFGNAKPHPYFNTPFAAIDDSAICPQYNKGIIKGTIQCLHLNVYTPSNANRSNTYPVMVFIHGGAFIEGDGTLSTYSPKFLVKHNIIIVTVNYRLGPYGFLCLQNTEYTNQGLKDQNLALKWVKNNIKSFGGDDANITLFGHSAGSISTDFHLLYNNDNLFNKVIMQSGQAATPYCNLVTNTSTFARDIGMYGENIDANRFVQTLTAIGMETIINTTKNYSFRPCIDEKFITKKPKIKNLQNIKVMSGVTYREMLFLYPTVEKQFYENFDFPAEIANGFSLAKMAEKADNAVDVAKKFYVGNEATKEAILDLVSDFYFNYPEERAVKYYVENNCTVYRYLFTYDGGRNYMKVREHITDAGSTHGDELGYLFDMTLFDNVISEDDQRLIERISLLWTNFAKFGDPVPTISDILPGKWPPVTAVSNFFLQIDRNLGVFTSPCPKRMPFWDLYYEKYGVFARGIDLGEQWRENDGNNAFNLNLSNVLLFVCICLGFL